MKPDFPFAFGIAGEIILSLFLFPIDLLEIGYVAVRLRARHEPEYMASMAIGAGLALLLASHGHHLSATLFSFGWIRRIAKLLRGELNGGVCAARDQAIRRSHELRLIAELMRQRKSQDARVT